jgi:hypothetical protein
VNPYLGQGNVYIQYNSVEQAREARKVKNIKLKKKELNGRLYNNHTVSCQYHDLKKFVEGNYCLITDDLVYTS